LFQINTEDEKHKFKNGLHAREAVLRLRLVCMNYEYIDAIAEFSDMSPQGHVIFDTNSFTFVFEEDSFTFSRINL
jgi:hypothetical protein